MAAIRTGTSSDVRIRVRTVSHDEIAANDFALVPERFIELASDAPRHDLRQLRAQVREATVAEEKAGQVLRDALQRLGDE